MLLGGSVHTERYDIFEIFLICQNIGFNMRRAVSRLFGNRQKDRLVSTCQEHQRGVTGPKGSWGISRTIGQCTFPHPSENQIADVPFPFRRSTEFIPSAQPSPAQPSPGSPGQASPELRQDASHRGKCKGSRLFS